MITTIRFDGPEKLSTADLIKCEAKLLVYRNQSSVGPKEFGWATEKIARIRHTLGLRGVTGYEYAINHPDIFCFAELLTSYGRSMYRKLLENRR